MTVNPGAAMLRRPLVTLAAVLLGSGAGGAATYPGPAPCDTTLQACINAAAPGEVVQIATDGPIAENLDIFEKSLTLEPAPGFTPTIDGVVDVSGAPIASVVTVQGLAVNGFIRATVGAGDLELHVLGNTVTLDSIAGGLAIFVSGSSPAGELTARIAGNAVTAGGGSSCEGIHVGPVASASTATVTGNQVTVLSGCSQGMGIHAANAAGWPLIVDILGNHVVAPGASSGILAINQFSSAGSLLQARIVNNVVTGQVLRVGQLGGLVVASTGATAIAAQVVNNTVVGNDSGLRVDANTANGATVTGVVANNLVAHNTAVGLEIDPGLEPAVTNDHNLAFDNGSEQFTPGPGTVTADPLLVSASDFHLQAGSPAIDAGNDARVPPDVTTDIEGNPRILGPAVDIGAYERQVELAPGEIPALSTLGAVALAALLALGGWALGRRT
jgi:hypothetical protein